MKKLTLLLIGILFTLIVAGQSHVFKNNQESIYVNNAWERWTSSAEIIEVKNESVGTYRISFYRYGSTRPRFVLVVKFISILKNSFKYNGYIETSQIGGLSPFSEVAIESFVKLSEMSQGYGGLIVIGFSNANVCGFKLSN